MKTFLVGIVTAVVAALGFGAWYSVHTAEWMICSVKLPGETAIRDIQADIDAKRHDVAKEKIGAFLKTWQRFSSGPDSCSGVGISDVMLSLAHAAERPTASQVGQPEIEAAKAIPWIPGAFRHVLNPPGMAPNSKVQWYINDHCIFIDGSNRLHWFGITNPYPKDRNYYGPGTHRHIGHAVAEHPFGPWQAREHALSLPADTKDNIGACFVVRGTNGYLMIYGYNEGFHFARSDDLETWQKDPGRAPLDLGKGTRDPCVHRLDDGTYLLYGAAGHAGRSAVVLASSRDLAHWTPESPALLSDLAIAWGALESPFLHRRGEDYYLFVNFSHRQYQETLVFHSRDPRKFDWSSPLCTLFAHAAEVFVWRGQTYITHCGIEDRHWSDIGAPYGLWLAELAWAKPITPNPPDLGGGK